MKKYGIRAMPHKDRSFMPVSVSSFSHCKDKEDNGYFGTDELNDAYGYNEWVYSRRKDTEVFEKNNE